MPPASRQPAARSPAKPTLRIKKDLVLKTSRVYGTTVRAIFRSPTSPNLWYAETEKPDNNSAPAKRVKSINKADAPKKIEAAKKTTPRKPAKLLNPLIPAGAKKAAVVKPTQTDKKPQTAAKRTPSPIKKPGAPKKLRVQPPW